MQKPQKSDLEHDAVWLWRDDWFLILILRAAGFHFSCGIDLHLEQRCK